jgi:hypothetical protein
MRSNLSFSRRARYVPRQGTYVEALLAVDQVKGEERLHLRTGQAVSPRGAATVLQCISWLEDVGAPACQKRAPPALLTLPLSDPRSRSTSPPAECNGQDAADLICSLSCRPATPIQPAGAMLRYWSTSSSTRSTIAYQDNGLPLLINDPLSLERDCERKMSKPDMHTPKSWSDTGNRGREQLLEGIRHKRSCSASSTIWAT